LHGRDYRPGLEVIVSGVREAWAGRPGYGGPRVLQEAAMEANVATPAALIGDPARAAMLMALMDDRTMPATALAWAAGVSPQSASNHLAKLVEGGLLEVSARGRHRYYRLAGANVAQALEALAVLGPLPRALDLPCSAKARRIREARTCYDHLAGRLGVALADAMEAEGLVERHGEHGLRLTGAGRVRLAEIGVDPKALAGRACIDWTERRRHIAGRLGRALTARLFALGWVERGREGRSVVVTAAGRTGLRDAFGVALEPARAA
jgi:DNA-binding transcriptional ArsR family regulator